MFEVLNFNHFIVLSMALFCIGIFGLLNSQKSIIRALISSEIMLLAANINFVAYSAFNNNVEGQVFSLFVLGVAATEVAVGLAIIVLYFKERGKISFDDEILLKDNK